MKNLFFLLLTVFCINSHAQIPELKFRHYSIEDGFSERSINEIFQDNTGFIWFCTPKGLNRFDGRRVSSFFDDFPNIFEDEFVNVYCIKQFHDELWIGTSRGLVRFNVITHSHKVYIADSTENSLSNISVFDILIDSTDQILWLGTWDGLDKLDLKTNTFSHYKPDKKNRYAFNSVGNIVIDNNNDLWISTRDGGISKFNTETEIFTNYRYDLAEPFFISNNRIRDIIADKDGCIWVASWGGGLIKIDPETNNKTIFKSSNDPFSISSNSVNAIFIDRENNFWIGTEDGLNIFDAAQSKFYIVQHDPDNEHSISSNVVMSVFKDTQGGLWLGTNNKGVDYYHKTEYKFKDYSYSNNNYNVGSFKRDHNGNLIIGVSNELRICSKYDQDKDLINLQKGIMPGYSYRSIINDSKQNYWFFNAKTIIKLNSELKRIKEYSHIDIFGSDYGYYISNLSVDDKDNLWISTDSGVVFFDKNKDVFQKKFIKGDASDLYDNRVTNVYFDSRKTMWVVTAHRLERWDSIAGKFIHYSYIKNDTNSIYAEGISSLVEDEDGILWIGTSMGLYSYNYKTDKFTNYSTKNGLANNSVRSIVIDDNKDLWLATGFGISVFNTNKKSFRNFDKRDGLPYNQFSRKAFYKSKDGEIYFGGRKALYTFNPKEIIQNTNIPNIILTGLTVNNKPAIVYNKGMLKENNRFYLPKEIGSVKEIVLKHDQANISIEFTSLNFAAHEKNQFAYNLKGISNEWFELGNNNVLHFSNLYHGKYVLQIIGSNNDNIWNTEGVTLNIRILPPWWKTWWFRSFVVIFLTTSIIAFYRIRMTSIQKRNIELEETVKLRTSEVVSQKEEIQTQAEELALSNAELEKLNATKDKFFSIIAHDLRNPFHSISSFSELLHSQFSTYPDEQKLEFIELIKKSSDGAASLLDNLLQWASTQTEKILFEPQLFNVYEIVGECVALLQVSAQKKSINIINDVSKKSNVYADKNMVTTIIRNLINNAIKFSSSEGTITISIKHKNQTVEIYVTDNGIGMDRQTMDKIFKPDQVHTTEGTSGEQGTGLGLILCKEFANKNGGDIRVESKLGAGSSFIVELPNDKVTLEQLEEKKETNNEDKTKEIKSFDFEGETPSVLVIDDIEEIRRSVTEQLKPYCEVSQAKNGEDGLKMAFESIPDLIISDIMMPEMDGIELCKIIKTDERTSHIPVILLTAQTKTEDKLEGLETGADDYVTKPFEASLLIARVRNLIVTRRKLREKFSKSTSFVPSELGLSSMDEKFMERALKLVEDNISNEKFSNDDFVEGMGMSRAQLYRKMKALTNQSVSEFISAIRLRHAAMLIRKGGRRVQEVAFAVGFKDASYFSKCFKSMFGVLPKEY